MAALTALTALTARCAPSGVANARRGSGCVCASRLHRNVSRSPLGHAGWPLTP